MCIKPYIKSKKLAVLIAIFFPITIVALILYLTICRLASWVYKFIVCRQFAKGVEEIMSIDEDININIACFTHGIFCFINEVDKIKKHYHDLVASDDSKVSLVERLIKDLEDKSLHDLKKVAVKSFLFARFESHASIEIRDNIKCDDVVVVGNPFVPCVKLIEEIDGLIDEIFCEKYDHIIEFKKLSIVLLHSKVKLILKFCHDSAKNMVQDLIDNSTPPCRLGDYKICSPVQRREYCIGDFS